MSFEWTKEKVQRLREVYPVHGSEPLTMVWGITRSAVCGKATRLGLAAPPHIRKHSAITHKPPPEAPEARPRTEWYASKRSTAPASATTNSVHRSRPGDTQAVIERVATKSKINRRCGGRDYQGNGKSMPCCNDAEPGRMWCGMHQEKIAALKESA